MKQFTQLYNRLDSVHRSSDKAEALATYFADATPEESAWAVFLLTGRKIPRMISPQLLRDWVAECAGLPPWLVEESYKTVGDLAETLALLLPECDSQCTERPLDWWIGRRLLPLRGEADAVKRRQLEAAWDELSRAECTVWHKLIMGTFRSPVKLSVLEQALAEQAQVPQSIIAERLQVSWEPTADAYRAIVSTKVSDNSVREAQATGDSGAETGDAVTEAGHIAAAILIYVQVERPNRPAEYTFGVWDNGVLVPVAKISGELAEKDRRKLDRQARLHTTERFGPVRAVEPKLVVELAFNGVTRSTRNKAGLSLSSPRLMRVREDLSSDNVGSLGDLRGLAHETISVASES